MFTFSFSSAFAKTTVSGNEDKNTYYMESQDYYLVNPTVDNITTGKYVNYDGKTKDAGTVGITDMERTMYINHMDGLKDVLEKNAYWELELGKNYDVAVKICDDAIEAIKAAKSSRDALKIVVDAQNDIQNLDNFEVWTSEINDGKFGKLSADYYQDIFWANFEASYKYFETKFLEKGQLAVIPGYFYAYKNGTHVAIAGVDNTGFDAFKAVLGWFYNNGYTTSKAINGALVDGSFLAAFDFLSDTTATIGATYNIYNMYGNRTMAGCEYSNMNSKGKLLAKKANALVEAVLDTDFTKIDDVYAAVEALDDFANNYGGIAIGTEEYGVREEAKEEASGYYFEQNLEKKWDAIADLTAEDKILAAKADIIEVWNAVNAFAEKYEDWSVLTTAQNTKLGNLMNVIRKNAFDTVEKAWTDADLPAANLLVTSDTEAFDKVKGVLEAFVTEFKEDLDNEATGYESAVVEMQAYILAGEVNLGTFKAETDKQDKIDTSKVQAYLNNATVKVTTKALGKGKVRAQATIDTTSFNYILGEMTDGAVVEYQFYYKKAANTNYKAGKVNEKNCRTYKLAKGVKYNFHCAVTLKDADGNVVATKDYMASTIGTRVAK